MLVDGPIDEASVRAAVAHPSCGAVLVFVGVSREDRPAGHGGPVRRLFYEAYAPMAEAEITRILDEARATWAGARIAVVHRVGEVPIGEASVVIAVATPHRDDAYAASRFVIDTLKRRVPIWKQEGFDDGTRWKANEG